MSNREKREYKPFVHVLLALARPSHGEKSKCIRTVDKGHGDEVSILEAKLKKIGGYWRIHRTVNARDVEKARKELIIRLINNPEKGAYVDSEWRTALLQSKCIYGAKKFMLDIDTKDIKILGKIQDELILKKIFSVSIYETPKGFHYITEPFDTREVCKIGNVSLIRDGYYFIKEVGKKS